MLASTLGWTADLRLEQQKKRRERVACLLLERIPKEFSRRPCLSLSLSSPRKARWVHDNSQLGELRLPTCSYSKERVASASAFRLQSPPRLPASNNATTTTNGFWTPLNFAGDVRVATRAAAQTWRWNHCQIGSPSFGRRSTRKLTRKVSVGFSEPVAWRKLRPVFKRSLSEPVFPLQCRCTVSMSLA